MHRIALIISLVFFMSLLQAGQANAQRALPGMRGVEARTGLTDGNGHYFGAAVATYAGNANKWVFGGEYLYSRYPYKDSHVPVAQFTGEAGYYKKILADGSKTFFLSLGASALAGYETVNWGDKLLFDGSTLRHRDRFLYGGALTLEVEAYLTDRLVLSLSARERILWGTTTGHFHFQYGAGVRFIIN